MWGARVYGIFIGIGSMLFIRAAPQPAGSILWWGLIASQLTWASTLCWRRTGLPFATAAMVVAAAGSGLLAILALAGYVFPDLPRVWWLPLGALMVSGPLLLLVESRVNRARWMQWKEYAQHMSAWEIFRGRHIPDLRDRSA